MDHTDFHSWCRDAVRQIIYVPDRDAVYHELKDHMEDRYDAYRELGLTDSQAIERTLKAMGDAKAIAPQLAEIHRPFWGFAYSICRTVFKLLIVIVASLSIGFVVDALDSAFSQDISGYGYDPYAEVTFSDDQQTSTRLSYTAPNVSYTDSGYKITLTDATHWVTDWNNTNRSNSEFYYFRMKINCLPWADAPTFCNWIWAEDSLGNIYYSDQETLHFYLSDEFRLAGSTLQTGPFTYTCTIRIWEYNAEDVGEIEWFDLHYDRGGRDMVFRAEIGGGDGA